MNMSKIVMGLGIMAASFGVVAEEVDKVRNVTGYSVQHFNPSTGLLSPYGGNPYYSNNYNGYGWGNGNGNGYGNASGGFNFGFSGHARGQGRGRGYSGGNWHQH
jgi:hypothetical protein